MKALQQNKTTVGSTRKYVVKEKATKRKENYWRSPTIFEAKYNYQAEVGII